MENKTEAPKQTMQEMEFELKQLEIQAKRAELEDTKERLAEREMKRETKRQRGATNGLTLKQMKDTDARIQRRCNHKKGGNGLEALANGQGDDAQYAVIKHQMCNGDIWVRCLRCGKTWKPVTEKEFTVDGKLDRAAMELADKEYKEAVAFTTKNVQSGSIQYRFSDGGEDFRNKMANVTLR